MSSSVDVVARLSCDVGEGPCWDSASSTLIFVDVTPGLIYRLSHHSGELSACDFGQEVGAAIPDEASGLVVAARDGIYRADFAGNEQGLIHDIEGDNPRNRMNDAKCDPQGRLWAGTMAFDFRPGAAALYRVDRNGAVKVLDDLTISNGLGWSPDGSLMYFIDSATQGIDVFDYDLATGGIANRRPFASLGPDGGMPDGMTIDREGGVWVAFFGSGQVRRFDPAGALDGVIDLPVRQVTSCTFGGPDLTHLFITSAAYMLTETDLQDQPLAGSVFRCEPGIAGTATVRCAV